MKDNDFVPFVQAEAGQSELSAAQECDNSGCYDCDTNCEECDNN